MSRLSQKKFKEIKRPQPPQLALFQSLNRDWLWGFFLLVFIFTAYQPAWNGKPIWDDNHHITRSNLRSIDGLTRIWTQLGATQQYYPLVHTVFWIEYHLWSDSTLGYHLINILLHFISALLLVCILRRLAIPGAWFVAAIFALHPVQVESVAWITELKNTLSGVFFLSAALAYLIFDKERKKKLYAIAIGLFVLGLFSKSVIATLPVSLLAVFWWRRGRIDWKNDVVPLLPFFAVGISYGLFTAWVEHKYIGADGDAFTLTIIERCLIAGRAIWFYLVKILLPTNLIFIYPHWNVSQAIWWQYLFPIATLILVSVLWTLRKRSRAPLAAFICFVATLFPVLGFFNVYPFRFSFVADHFQYLGCIIPIALFVGSASAISLFKGNIQLVFYTIVLMTLGGLTWKQSALYADGETLYKAVIDKNTDCWMAYNNLGVLLQKTRPADEAIAYYQKALQINPNYAEAYNNLGNALSQIGRTDEGITYLQKALEINPNYAEAHSNLGILLEKSGRIHEAIDHYRKALEIKPGIAEAYNNLGNSLSQIGQTDEAIIYYKKALAINPDYIETHNNLGALLEKTGQIEEAISHYEKVLNINPNYWQSNYNLGKLLMKTGRSNEAIIHYQKALQTNPNYADAHNNLGNAFLQTGQVDEAIAHYQRALEINPNKINTLQNLASTFEQKGQLPDAISFLQKALTLAKSAGDESMIKEITMNLDRLNQMIRSSPQGSR